jgi:hypothetical protein
MILPNSIVQTRQVRHLIDIRRDRARDCHRIPGEVSKIRRCDYFQIGKTRIYENRTRYSNLILERSEMLAM